MPTLWHCLEAIPGLVALPDIWIAWTDEDFEPFKTLCLQASARLATYIPCPRLCGCDHFIFIHHDRTGAIAVCRCTPDTCPDVALTIAEITPFQLSWSRLGRALRKAFDLDSKP